MAKAQWFYADNGQSVGPLTKSELLAKLPPPKSKQE